jgi:hypothetical protein
MPTAGASATSSDDRSPARKRQMPPDHEPKGKPAKARCRRTPAGYAGRCQQRPNAIARTTGEQSIGQRPKHVWTTRRFLDLPWGYTEAGRRVRIRIHATAPGQQRTNQQHTRDPHDLTPSPRRRRHVVRSRPRALYLLLAWRARSSRVGRSPTRKNGTRARMRSRWILHSLALLGRFEEPRSPPGAGCVEGSAVDGCLWP